MKNTNYVIDHTSQTIILSRAFVKEASDFGTKACKDLLKMKAAMPNYTVEVKEIKKNDKKKTYANLTYENMEMYIININGENSPSHQTYKKVRELAKAQGGQYAYVKKWFLSTFGDEFGKVYEEKESA